MPQGIPSPRQCKPESQQGLAPGDLAPGQPSEQAPMGHTAPSAIT